jgi:hypothetical protein
MRDERAFFDPGAVGTRRSRIIAGAAIIGAVAFILLVLVRSF